MSDTRSPASDITDDANTVSGEPQKSRKRDNLKPRSAPVQGRSIKRSKEILDVTGELLERVGMHDLTTNVIAREVGISVGSLYHYFPNKHAILYAMGQRWLEDITAMLADVEALPVETLSVEQLVEQLTTRNLRVYKRQKAVLALVQAMFSIPELHELDERHDDQVIQSLARVFKRLGINRHVKERERIGRFVLEVSHAVYLVIVNQNPNRAARTLEDLRFTLENTLHRHLQDTE
ncbi:TetR/AcrR family transcriptional regulator [Oceanobacter kriegii]|uniref:TetR/AcrR family transcriptional regulator n=1 Tax=Oceanobacter kriegii TaxID=64972 RepID=UPI00041EE2AF|nr:TetR/AcrR family transcriptional regulator [Oceanobacter kriegii]